jgi:hypothetical protein
MSSELDLLAFESPRVVEKHRCDCAVEGVLARMLVKSSRDVLIATDAPPQRWQAEATGA